jgi:hypothetical protein
MPEAVTFIASPFCSNTICSCAFPDENGPCDEYEAPGTGGSAAALLGRCCRCAWPPPDHEQRWRPQVVRVGDVHTNPDGGAPTRVYEVLRPADGETIALPIAEASALVVNPTERGARMVSADNALPRAQDVATWLAAVRACAELSRDTLAEDTGPDGDMEGSLRAPHVWAAVLPRLIEAIDLLRECRTIIEATLHDFLCNTAGQGVPADVADAGRMYVAEWTRDRRAWQNYELVSTVRRAMLDAVAHDPETGEARDEAALNLMGAAFDWMGQVFRLGGGTARMNELRSLGIDPNEFCDSSPQRRLRYLGPVGGSPSPQPDDTED